MNTDQTAHPHSAAGAASTEYGQDAEAAADARASEIRRGWRRLALESARGICLEALTRLNNGTACKLPYDEQEAFERVKDPYLAMDRLTRSLCRVVAMEERLDESAEARAERLAKEQAEREKAAREAQAWAEGEPERTKKTVIRRTVRNVHRDAEPDLDRWEREDILNEAFSDYEDFEDYGGDPVEIILRICTQLGLGPVAKDQPNGKPEKPEQTKARAEAYVREYLADIVPDGAANGNTAAPQIPAPQAKGRSPPG